MGSPNHDVRAEKDEDLLVLMSWQTEHPDLARAACGEFYSRHVEYLYARLRKHRESVGEHGVEDLVMDAFKRAYEKAHTYSPIKSSDPDAARRNVRAWLGTIASRLLQDQLRRPDSALKLVGDWESDEPLASNAAEASGGAEDQLIGKALATLTLNERRVVDVTMQYYAPGEKHQRLPSGVAEDLAASLDTSVENLRQLRKRAFDKLRDYVAKSRQAAEQGIAP